MGNNMNLALCSFIYLCSFIAFIASQECTTPENARGQCILLQDCPQLNNLLQKRPVSQETVEQLRKAHCGFSGKQPKVCCSVSRNPSPGSNGNLLPSRMVCGKQRTNRIVGGELTELGEFPWMALLEYNKPSGRGFSCGGSLINNRYILTAAHCLLRVPKTWRLISVRLGEHDLSTKKDCASQTAGFDDCSDEPLDIGIEEAIPHELYKPNNLNQPYDIALLRLEREVPFTDYIIPICLPLASDLRKRDYFGQNLTVAGWGRTENRTQSQVKLKVEVPVKRLDECSPIYKQNGVTLTTGQLCAGGVEAKDSCTGDSGGPLMVEDLITDESNYIIYGIVSFGPVACGMKDFPGIYTRVADYVDWIQEKIRP